MGMFPLPAFRTRRELAIFAAGLLASPEARVGVSSSRDSIEGWARYCGQPIAQIHFYSFLGFTQKTEPDDIR